MQVGYKLTIVQEKGHLVVVLTVSFGFRRVLLDFSITVKATTLIFISGSGSAIPSAKEGKSGFIYNLE